MNTGDNIRESILEFWRSFAIILLAIAVGIAYIYLSEANAWKKQQQKLELAAKQRAIFLAEQASAARVWTFINVWKDEVGVEQFRRIERLKPGEEYQVGALQRYDVNLHRGFDQVIPERNDNSYYSDPIITVAYENLIHARYSINGGGGWLLGGETLRGLKTDNLQYIPSDPESNDERDFWGQGILSVQIPINGRNGLAVGMDNAEVSEDMRAYNYFIDQRLDEVYKNVPPEFAGRTRRVYVSHLIIEAWKDDPREWRRENKGKTTKPEFTVKLMIRDYGSWDLTAEEYASLIFDIPLFSSRDFRSFSPYTTVELIV